MCYGIVEICCFVYVVGECVFNKFYDCLSSFIWFYSVGFRWLNVCWYGFMVIVVKILFVVNWLVIFYK